MDGADLKTFYEAMQGIGTTKLDRSEFEARHVTLEARVLRLETEQDTRYENLLKMISEIKDAIAKRDESKLTIIFTAVLSFIGGGGLLGILIALHVIH